MPNVWWFYFLLSVIFFIMTNIVARKSFSSEGGLEFFYAMQTVVFCIASIIFFLRSFLV